MAETTTGNTAGAGNAGGAGAPKGPATSSSPAKPRETSGNQVDGAQRDLVAAERDTETLRRVSTSSDTLLAMRRDELGAERAREAVQDDVAALRTIEAPDVRRVVAHVMGQVAHDQAAYRAELERQAPAIAAEARTVFAEQGPLQRAASRMRDEVDLELELGAEAERDSVTMTGPEKPRRESGVRLGARPAAAARVAAATVGDGKSAAAAAAPGAVPKPAKAATAAGAALAEEELEDEVADEEEALRRKRAAEAAQAAVAENAVDARPSGRELERAEIIVPRRITQAYTEVDGKFFAKDSSRIMFEDKGLKLATSGTNKETIADMVALARAKNWQSIKLTGAQEFRREAWLEAESQGVKTQGYTPKEADLAALKALTLERATNVIAPVTERGRDRVSTKAGAGVGAEVKQAAQQRAPRHDLNKNQAAMHVEAMKNVTSNMQVLQELPGSEGRSGEELKKLAYWRGIVQEESRGDPVRQEEALKRFDEQTADPQFVARITRETQGSINEKTVDRTQKRDTHEQSL